jgi:hypothetical protein
MVPFFCTLAFFFFFVKWYSFINSHNSIFGPNFSQFVGRILRVLSHDSNPDSRSVLAQRDARGALRDVQKRTLYPLKISHKVEKNKKTYKNLATVLARTACCERAKKKKKKKKKKNKSK